MIACLSDDQYNSDEFRIHSYRFMLCKDKNENQYKDEHITERKLITGELTKGVNLKFSVPFKSRTKSRVDDYILTI